ncbi:MAG TPA: AsmA family protein [Casimicrobiaceae bacterium]|nr:AsmA family protein [Casimicrobiaceae bacterium]
MQIPKKVWVFAALAAVIAITLAFFDWNWLRGPLASYLSAKVGRPVRIEGNLHVALSTRPLLTADYVTVGNAPWGSEPTMANAQRVNVRLNLRSLLWGPLVLHEARLVRPRLLLEKSSDGKENWEVGGAGPPALPLPGRLTIDDGVVRYRDPGAGTDVSVNIASAASSASGATPVHFSGSGRLRKSIFTIEGNAESLLALEDRHQPYRLDVKARAGDTSAHFDGTVIPARLDSVDGLLMLQGRDLSELYPIIPVPFPWTPPYRLNGRLKHGTALWSFDQFSGKVGDSDLAGRFNVDKSGTRLLVDADLVSQSLNYKDLGGLIGLPPATQTPSAKSAAQKKETAKRAQTGRALPTKPYDPDHLRAIDAKVHLKGKRFMTSELPLDNLNAVLDLHAGVLTLQPLDFGVGGGHVVSTLVMDAREQIFKTRGEVTVRNVELSKVLPKLKPPQGSAGKVGGQAHFIATGNSIADMLATSNGEAALISWGGDASELSVVLTNLDLARAAQLLLKGDEKAAIRCVVADFVADDGRMVAKTLVIDTDAEKILGAGSIDFAKERYDLTLSAQSKRPSLLALRGPIVVDGSFSAPQVHPAVGPIAARVASSLALGALNPLAALLPLIDPGGSKDADCRGLMQEAKESEQARSNVPAHRTPPELSSKR